MQNSFPLFSEDITLVNSKVEVYQDISQYDELEKLCEI